MTAHDTICSVYGLTPLPVDIPIDDTEVEFLKRDSDDVSVGVFGALEDGFFKYVDPADKEAFTFVPAKDVIGWRPARRVAA